MELQLVKELLDYGGMVLIAIGMFIWLTKVDIPRREKRHAEDRTATLAAFKEERHEILNAFKEDRTDILNKLEAINRSLYNSSRTCAINRSLGMVQFLMEHDNVPYETATAKVQQYWRTNGIELSPEKPNVTST